MKTDAEDPFIGQTVLGRYRVIRLLAVGGMGKVYLARGEGSAGFVKPVVIKRLLPEYSSSQEVVRMFVREARIMANLQHPGIAAVYDFGEHEDSYVLAMEYVHGFPLSRWVRFLRDRNEPFPVEVARHVTLQVLDALQYAHSLVDSDGKSIAVVHRDVTPSNVLIDLGGRVKLLDFGIARATNDATQPGEGGNHVKGKFAYIAPEIFSGSEPSPQSDVYSCAMLLHEVLLGRNEFFDRNLEQTVMNVMRKAPARLDVARADVPRGLAEAVEKGLAKSTEDRWASAYEFAVALRATRNVAVEQARDETAALATRDFLDPKISAETGIDLAVLDRAWREFVPSATSLVPDAPDPTPPTLSVSDVPGAPDATRRPPRRTPAVSIGPERRARRWALVAGGLALLAVGSLVGVWVATRATAPAGAGQAIYVEGTGGGGGGTESASDGSSPARTDSDVVAAGRAGTHGNADANANANANGDASAPAVATSAIDAGRAGVAPVNNGTAGHASRGGEVAPPDRSLVLTRVFSRERMRVARCFEGAPADVSQRGEIQLRFEVGLDGRPITVAVIPADLAGTSFGRCVVAIGRSVDFGAQPAPIAFRIPISVRRTGG